MAENKCQDCEYFKLTPPEGRDPKAFGICRRYAPRWSPQFAVAVSKDTRLQYLSNGWPIVSCDSWCGEHKEGPDKMPPGTPKELTEKEKIEGRLIAEIITTPEYSRRRAELLAAKGLETG